MAEVVTVSPRVDWGAIFAGAVLATAVALILLAFGTGLGLSVSSPYEGEGLAPAFYAFAAGLWLLWIQLVSFTIGGYVTARLRNREPAATEHEIDVRDGLHGLLMWGVGVIAAAVIAFAGLGGVTAAVEGSDGRDVVSAVANAASQEIDEAAAREPAVNPEARDETVSERRAETARKLTVLSAFITAASLLAGAAAAFYAAGVGGKHRDQNTQLAFFVIRR